ncbi:MAG: tetratricopeptide repeat protein, partial [Planctomycetota bacterium]
VELAREIGDLRARTKSEPPKRRRDAKPKKRPAPPDPIWRRPLVQAAFLLPVFFLFCNVRTPLLEAQSLKRVDYLNFGALYKNRGELDTAESLLRRSLAIDPRYGPAYTELAEVYRLRGDDLAAAQLAQQGRQFRLSGQYETPLDPTAAIADSVLRMTELYRAGDHVAALAGFERLRLLPEAREDPAILRSLLNNIGLCHYKLGDLKNAEALFRDILASDSTYVKAYNNLGLILAVTGRPAEAAASFRTALRLDPGNASAERGLTTLGVSD